MDVLPETSINSSRSRFIFRSRFIYGFRPFFRSGKITLFGTVNLKECIIDPDIKLPIVQLIATNQLVMTDQAGLFKVTIRELNIIW